MARECGSSRGLTCLDLRWDAAPVNVDTPGRQLLFSTVRISNILTNGLLSTGTGFLLWVQLEQDQISPLLVTNKHVVADSQQLVLHFIGRKPDSDQPALGQAVDAQLDPNRWVGHPDPSIDVAVVPLAPLYLQGIGQQIFTRALHMGLLASEVKELYTDAIEEITFIGYPDGRHDPKHLTPIVRRGITATPLDLDMGGAPTFLVDGSVFGGSSGSPVFLFNEGTYRSAAGLHVGTRTALVGIISATWVRRDALPVEVAATDHVKIAKELNLGVAFNSRAIKETIEAFTTEAGLKIKAVDPNAPVAVDPAAEEPESLA